ncbi:MAG: hypothetical protein M0R51_06585 [Clostridia bacterium]|nr:hypothetical protein [Clostridia bacterium]
MAILNVYTERKTTSEHLRIQDELIPVITEMFNTEVATVSFYRTKETHGDLDLLILNTGDLGNIGERLKARFGPVYCNGNVYSFEYQKYQVDIIPQPTRNWETAKDFFSWDPTGNLMGKIAHKFGLKYGFEGLIFPFRTFSGRLTTDIVISKDSRKIFEFLGYDYDRYLKGFDTTEEIFEWIIEGKYFNVDNFQMENLNHIDRKRNAKRSTYQGFLEYAEKNNVQSKFTFLKNKEEYHDTIDSFFPEANFKTTLLKLQETDKRNQRVSEAINGDMIMEATGLKGQELGKVITAFKENVANNFKDGSYNDAIASFIDSGLNPMEIFMDYYSIYKSL